MNQDELRTLFLALDLAKMPALARMARHRPLPAGVLTLIKLAARCPDTSREAARLTRAAPDHIRESAALYLESVLLCRDSDHYRTLGVTSHAPDAVLSEHFRWLMKWLHPDRSRTDWESAFAEKVASAWQELKSPERRARYDWQLLNAKPLRSSRDEWHSQQGGFAHPRLRIPWIAVPIRRNSFRQSPHSLLVAAIVAAAALVAFLLLANWWPGASSL